MTTLQQFAAKTAALGPKMREAEVAAVKAGAQQAVGLIRDEIRAVAPGGTLKMNGKPKRVGASFKMGTGSQASVSAEGPMQLIERDTASHFEPRGSSSTLLGYRTNKRTGATTVRERKRRGRSAVKVLSIPGIGFRRTVIHPGTKGRHPFEKGKDAARHEVGPRLMDKVSGELGAALR